MKSKLLQRTSYTEMKTLRLQASEKENKVEGKILCRGEKKKE